MALYHRMTLVTIPNITASRLLGPNPDRRLVSFYVQALQVQIYLGSPSVGGVPVFIGGDAVSPFITYDDVGQLITGEIWQTNQVGGQVTCIEQCCGDDRPYPYDECDNLCDLAYSVSTFKKIPGANGVRVIGSNPRRRGIILYHDVNAGFSPDYSPYPSHVWSIAPYFQLSDGYSGLLDYAHWGSLTTSEWFASWDPGATTATGEIIELFVK